VAELLALFVLSAVTREVRLVKARRPMALEMAGQEREERFIVFADQISASLQRRHRKNANEPARQDDS
jgi:hypothetical protein